MMHVQFTIPGFAVPEGRPRSTVIDGHVHTYKPSASRSFAGVVRTYAGENRPPQLFDGPISVSLIFYLAKPKSAPKREKYPAKKPDIDNLVKAITDGCEGIIFTNDSRIVDLNAIKRYDPVPRVIVRIEEVIEASSLPQFALL